MQLSFKILPDLDKWETKKAVEEALETYRMYKFLVFEEKEARITAVYSDMPRSSPTNVTSDQTADIATYNVDRPAAMKTYVDRIDGIVSRMKPKEKTLMEKRYLNRDHFEYDNIAYDLTFDNPISSKTYDKIRWKAIEKLARALGIGVEKE
ncbi:ArpU family phage packaging/lysis transcriptional regulator [Paenibacillus sp. SYP-B3998]|nr:ArpU family phage packaging/lysis transcriptional regulator [Paenibacillus sp. SYP-B3998]